jgi:hypothetical protein
MKRDIALKLDTFLASIRGHLDMAAHFMKNNLSEEDYKKYIYNIGRGMAELVEISNDLHKAYPDIIADELRQKK